MTPQPRCERCRRFVKAGAQHCDDCAVTLYAFYLPGEMHWRDVHRERAREVAVADLGYGFPSCVRDPRDFLPDLGDATESNRRNWIEACEIAASGGTVDLSVNAHVHTARLHVSRTAWGLGTYIWRESEVAA